MIVRRTNRLTRVVSVTAIAAGALLAATPLVASAAPVTQVQQTQAVVAHLGTFGPDDGPGVGRVVNITQAGDYRIRLTPSTSVEQIGLDPYVRVAVQYDQNPNEQGLNMYGDTTVLTTPYHLTKGAHRVDVGTPWAVGFNVTADLVKG